MSSHIALLQGTMQRPCQRKAIVSDLALPCGLIWVFGAIAWYYVHRFHVALA